MEPLLATGHPFTSGTLSSLIVPVVLAVVFLGGVAGRYYPEVYPIAPWNMFSNTPSKIGVHTVLLHSLDGRAFASPVRATRVPETAAVFDTPKGMWSVRLLCEALERAAKGAPGAAEAVARERAKVEAMLGKHRARYEPVKLEVDPIAYLQGGAAVHETSYGRLETGVPLTPEAMRDGRPARRAPTP